MSLAGSKAKSLVKRVFLGWWVLLTAMSLQVIVSSFTMQSFGLYIAVMRAEFGWSTTAFAIAFAILQAGGGFLGPVVGMLLSRYGPRRVIRVGLLIFAVGMFLFSMVNSLVGLYAAIVVIALGSALAGFLPLNTIAVQWFDRWRSTALALMQTGISIAGLVVPLIAWLLASYGWRSTSIMTAIIILLVALPLTYFIGNKPEDYGLVPDGIEKPPLSPEAATINHDFTAREAMQTRAFWFISFGHGLALMIVFAILAHLVVYLTDDRGFSLQLAGVVVALMTSMSIVGQLLGGFLGDRLNKRLLATLAMFGHASSLLMLVYSTTLGWVFGFAVLHGFSWGLRGPIMQSIRADYFGRKHFGQIMGFSSVVVTMGIVLGPLIVGGFVDLLGSYRFGFSVLAVLATLGSVFFVLASPPRRL